MALMEWHDSIYCDGGLRKIKKSAFAEVRNMQKMLQILQKQKRALTL